MLQLINVDSTRRRDYAETVEGWAATEAPLFSAFKQYTADRSVSTETIAKFFKTTPNPFTDTEITVIKDFFEARWSEPYYHFASAEGDFFMWEWLLISRVIAGCALTKSDLMTIICQDRQYGDGIGDWASPRKDEMYAIAAKANVACDSLGDDVIDIAGYVIG